MGSFKSCTKSICENQIICCCSLYNRKRIMIFFFMYDFMAYFNPSLPSWIHSQLYSWRRLQPSCAFLLHFILVYGPFQAHTVRFPSISPLAYLLFVLFIVEQTATSKCCFSLWIYSTYVVYLRCGRRVSSFQKCYW